MQMSKSFEHIDRCKCLNLEMQLFKSFEHIDIEHLVMQMFKSFEYIDTLFK